MNYLKKIHVLFVGLLSVGLASADCKIKESSTSQFPYLMCSEVNRVILLLPSYVSRSSRKQPVFLDFKRSIFEDQNGSLVPRGTTSQRVKYENDDQIKEYLANLSKSIFETQIPTEDILASFSQRVIELIDKNRKAENLAELEKSLLKQRQTVDGIFNMIETLIDEETDPFYDPTASQEGESSGHSSEK